MKNRCALLCVLLRVGDNDRTDAIVAAAAALYVMLPFAAAVHSVPRAASPACLGPEDTLPRPRLRPLPRCPRRCRGRPRTSSSSRYIECIVVWRIRPRPRRAPVRNSHVHNVINTHAAAVWHGPDRARAAVCVSLCLPSSPRD